MFDYCEDASELPANCTISRPHFVKALVEREGFLALAKESMGGNSVVAASVLQMG
jgi:hypothetical protein